jgi:hypothetical protein
MKPYSLLSPEKRRAILIEYLHAKVYEGDWHGVSDAANDLRELEAQFPKIRKVIVDIPGN